VYLSRGDDDGATATATTTRRDGGGDARGRSVRDL
jgi:hypothetical protein